MRLTTAELFLKPKYKVKSSSSYTSIPVGSSSSPLGGAPLMESKTQKLSQASILEPLTNNCPMLEVFSSPNSRSTLHFLTSWLGTVIALLPRERGGPSTLTPAPWRWAFLVQAGLELLTHVCVCSPGSSSSLQSEAWLGRISQLLIRTAPGRGWRYEGKASGRRGLWSASDVALSLGEARIFTLYCHSVFALFRCPR